MRLGARLPEGQGPRLLEGDRARVHFVVGAVHQLDEHVGDREAAEDARPGRVADAGLDGRDELPRDGAAGDPLHEDHAVLHDEFLALGLLGGDRGDADHHVAELAAAAGLLDEASAHLRGRGGDRLAVTHAGCAELDVDLPFFDELVLDDLQVQLAHPGDDGLAGLVVVGEPEGGILSVDDAHGVGQALLVVAGRRLD